MKPRLLRKVTKVTALCFVLVALSASVFLRYAGPRVAEARVADFDLRFDQANPCTARPPGATCPDTDNNSCTIARCSGAGICEQSSVIRPDGTPCTGGAPGCVAGKMCVEGECRFRSGGGNPSQVSSVSLLDVDVQAAEPRVRKKTAFTDCCAVCEEQTLEALVPTSGLPARVEADGRLPLRRKFCGTITRYGVNDETDDPRDIMLNILPAQVNPYPLFVQSFLNTEDTPLKGDDIRKFGPPTFFPPVAFNLQRCLERASEPEIKNKKVIHAEVTPDEHFYGADARFMPIESTALRCGATQGFPTGVPLGGNPKCLKCIDGWDCKSELEAADGPTGMEVCVYGVYALDHGGHSASSHTEFCRSMDPGHDRPEIHPFDAIWWRHPERKGWMFGVFQDDSNRYSEPYCGSQHNGNGWSQAPRDMTFRFPFKFPLGSAPIRACLRHVRTRRLLNDAPNTVLPMNITTGEFVNPQTELTVLTIGGRRLLELVRESRTERETHVRVEGRIVGGEVVGQIVLRVAVGAGPQANAQTLFDRLSQINRLAIYDKGDKGAGFYYAELTFECDCPS